MLEKQVNRAPADPILTPRADCALTSVCRLAVVVNRRAAQSALTGQFPIGLNSHPQMMILDLLTSEPVL